MFGILSLDKSSNTPPSLPKVAKSKPIATKNATATVSKPPETDNVLDDVDFLDFVPIENNSNDFELDKILAQLPQNDIQIESKDKEPI